MEINLHKDLTRNENYNEARKIYIEDPWTKTKKAIKSFLSSSSFSTASMSMLANIFYHCTVGDETTLCTTAGAHRPEARKHLLWHTCLEDEHHTLASR
jgi:hypothetical protein